MKKSIIIHLLSKSQLVFFAVCFFFVCTTSFVLQTSQAKESTEHVSKLGYTIVLDAGHGGIDPGSIGYKTKSPESELNLAYTLLLDTKLQNAGISTVLTRKTSNGLYGISTANYKKRDMQKRKEIIEQANPNLVISIHMNSFTNHSLRGAQVFYDGKSDISVLIAKSIQTLFHKKVPCSKSEVSKGDYFMLKCSQAPAIIVECGFLSNAEDEANLLKEEYKELIVNCIFEGVINFISQK